MPTVEITTSGFDELIADIKNAPKDIMPFLKKEADQAVLTIIGEVGKYPSATAANSPGRMRDGKPMGFYVRSQGWYYPVKAGGKQVSYRLGKRSEQLKEHWAHKATVSPGELTETIGNTVSYFPYVQGDQQSALFAKIGWKQLDLSKYKDLINDVVDRAMDAWSRSKS